jgi:hypothetical protein
MGVLPTVLENSIRHGESVVGDRIGARQEIIRGLPLLEALAKYGHL